MGGRLISLADYRELHGAGNVRERSKGPSLRARPKKGSRGQPMKTRQRVVGSHVDSIDRVTIPRALSRTNVSPKWWDYRFILPSVFVLSCLALVAFGL
jgi:hypothetical protein